MAVLSNNIKQFWSKLGQSNEQGKLKFVSLAREIGLEISVEEIQSASGLTDELTDDQLEGVIKHYWESLLQNHHSSGLRLFTHL